MWTTTINMIFLSQETTETQRTMGPCNLNSLGTFEKARVEFESRHFPLPLQIPVPQPLQWLRVPQALSPNPKPISTPTIDFQQPGRPTRGARPRILLLGNGRPGFTNGGDRERGEGRVVRIGWLVVGVLCPGNI